MAQTSSGLQRSGISFRRQGSSGLVWDDRFVSGEIARPNERPHPRFYSGELSRPNKAQQHKQKQQQKQQQQQQRSRLHLNDDLNTVNPAINLRPIKTVRSDQQNNSEIADPPSPRLKGCGVCCGGLGKTPRSGRVFRPVRSRPRFRKKKIRRRLGCNSDLKRKVVTDIEECSLRFLDTNDDADSLAIPAKKKGKRKERSLLLSEAARKEWLKKGGEGSSSSGRLSRDQVFANSSQSFQLGITLTLNEDGVAVVEPEQPPSPQ